ncbi:fasciclin domain-containing protein [Viscerimonas tarda]
MRIKNIFLLFFCLVVFVQCNDYDKYFDEPDWLAKPVYQVLADEGRFTSYLQLVDRTPYAPVLKEGGIYTVFAPNNEAFATYLQKKGYASVADIPQEEANTIVAYSMVFSDWKLSNLGDYYNGVINREYLPGQSFKKKTNFHEGIYQDPDNDGNWVIDQNGPSGFSYDVTTGALANNFKYLPVFMDSYASHTGFLPSDYNTFFPNTPYTGRNLIDGEIVLNPAYPEGIIARNGVVQEVNVVNYPLPNLDKVLRDPQYSVFKNELLDYKTLAGAWAFKVYWEPVLAVTDFYKKLHPELNIEHVYVKAYDESFLAFSPAFESAGRGATNTEQTGFTMFIPTNEALQQYINDKILKYYDDIKDVPLDAIFTLINTHMADGMVYPSTFKGEKVYTGEYLNGLGSTGAGYDDFGVVDKKYASNGLIYTIDHVIKSSLFETVYSEMFLNPDYSILNAAYIKYFFNSLRTDLMRSIISGYDKERYTLIQVSDAQLREDGFVYDANTDGFSNSLVLSGNAEGRVRQLIPMHLFKGYKDNDVNTEITSFAGGDGPGTFNTQYNGWAFRVSAYGDLIRFKNDRLQATGNVEDNTFVTVKKLEAFDNGTVWTTDYEGSNREFLQYSPRKTKAGEAAGWTSGTLWRHIEKAGVENRNVTTFVNYVKAALKATDTDELSGIAEGNFYTILMVSNTYMLTAQSQGLVPPLAAVEANANNEKEAAALFLRAHFLQGRVYADDGLAYLYPYNVNQPTFELASTMYRANKESLGLINQRTYVRVTKAANGNMTFIPQTVTSQDGALLVDVAKSRPATAITTGVALTRGAVSASSPDNFRSNRPAGNAVIHELNGYFGFEVQ